jgi:hypothetical protein
MGLLLKTSGNVRQRKLWTEKIARPESCQQKKTQNSRNCSWLDNVGAYMWFRQGFQKIMAGVETGWQIGLPACPPEP